MCIPLRLIVTLPFLTLISALLSVRYESRSPCCTLCSNSFTMEHEHQRWEGIAFSCLPTMKLFCASSNHLILFVCFPTEMWSAGLKPGELFDKMSPSPLLLKYIETSGLLPDGRALVPGFGRGYDLTALASPTRQVVGLEIAQTAISAAQERLDSTVDFPFKEQISFQCRSFFDLNPSSNPATDSFDLVYDYTFLCALDPAIRGDWADKMAEIVKPGGLLLTLIYPIFPAGLERAGGPPFAVSLSLLEELLLSRGFQCEELRMLEADECHPTRDGSLTEGFNAGANSGVGRWRRVASKP